MIDLCKLFGVEEGEEFGFKTLRDGIYKVENNVLLKKYKYDDKFDASRFLVNEIANYTVIKLPKKKEFTDDELCILRNIDTKYKWLARDEYREILYVYKEKPEKTEDGNWYSEGWCRIGIYNHLFKCIQWRDEEPLFIDDYVERGGE